MNSGARKPHKLLFYVLSLALFGGWIYWILDIGKGLEAGRTISVTKAVDHSGFDAVLYDGRGSLPVLLVQILLAVGLARLFGWVAARLGQPKVIGEIMAGILLGPSLFAFYLPDVHQWVFPESSMDNLKLVSQMGLILFMFKIGMDLDVRSLRGKASDALVISHASILFPFALGVLLAFGMYSGYAPENVRFVSFALFMGIAMSITAFPVLARIVQERGLAKTRLGTLALTCAAADDITAWCILAVVVAIVKATSVVSALYMVGMTLLYVAGMVYGVRPWLRRIAHTGSSRDRRGMGIVGLVLLVLGASAYATELIGIHALFGAFLAGAILPEQERFRSQLIQKVAEVSALWLLPLFFMYTGLKTRIGLLDSWQLWGMTGGIVVVAVVGKFAGSTLAARYVGQSWKDSLSIGALMNTRGLMEVIVLNIGYDLGILSPEVFAMMILMALLTTTMTGPSLNLIQRMFR
jgi:Kef-type K+ transport system membrane component KefB